MKAHFLFLVLLVFVVAGCKKSELQIPEQSDPNMFVVSTEGGTLTWYDGLYNKSHLIIPEGAFEQATNIGSILVMPSDSYVDSLYPVVGINNIDYRRSGFFFYPWNAPIAHELTLQVNMQVSTNPNFLLNFNNVHVFKIKVDFSHEDLGEPELYDITPGFGNYYYSQEDNWIEITNFTQYTQTLDNLPYQSFKIPVDSFEYIYVVFVEAI